MAAACLAGLAACGAPAEGPEKARPDFEVHPRDFAVLPCTGVAVPHACAIVMAGGKTVLIGAPEGAYRALEALGVAAPDLVLLPDLSAARLEGLLRVRNGSWRAGRATPLAVIGPDGTEAMAAALDQAMERADAVTHVRSAPAGGFASAVMRAADLSTPQARPVYDTGDLSITGHADGPDAATFSLRYGGIVLEVRGCTPTSAEPDPGPDQRPDQRPEQRPDERADRDRHRSLSCDGDDLVWPIRPPGVLLSSEGRAVTEKNASR